ncbi:MAG: winged helix-turn-helix transcriptional regulator [Chloroflexi bacterium]|nr:winged helix-turn-helix transcriptional regulator [Chloroflexota bacterium]
MASDEHELRILEEIERNPETTQANLAGQLGVAVGSVNWYLKRLVNKGYVKVTHLQRRKLHYFLTPSGLALKVRLTHSYMQVSLRTYRELRASARKTLGQVRRNGYAAVCVQGDDEAAEILRLTCLEQGIRVEPQFTDIPLLRFEGKEFTSIWPERDAYQS